MRSNDDDIFVTNYEQEVDCVTKAVKIVQVEFRRYTEPTKGQRKYVDILMECEHICPICDTSNGKRYDWGFVERDLRNGKEVRIVQSKP